MQNFKIVRHRQVGQSRVRIVYIPATSTLQVNNKQACLNRPALINDLGMNENEIALMFYMKFVDRFPQLRPVLVDVSIFIRLVSTPAWPVDHRSWSVDDARFRCGKLQLINRLSTQMQPLLLFIKLSTSNSRVYFVETSALDDASWTQ